MAELDPRKQLILRAIVVEYVGLAEPIASDALIQKYELGVRSATIRNEMAEMSELGFLEQPHTSAGRIPSDKGYRYYVDRLIEDASLDAQDKKAVKGAAESDHLHDMLRATARSLSRLTQLLSVAATVRERDTVIKTAVISALDSRRVIFVFVLSNGHVENRMLEVPAGLTLDDIGFVNETLAGTAVGQTIKAASRGRTPPCPRSSASAQLTSLVWTSLRAFAKDLTRGKMITEGEEFILAQPEFSRDAASLHRLLDQLANADELYDAVTSDPARQVTIGSENRNEGLRSLSVIRQTFYVGENEAGVIALIGPTRLNYSAGIPLVNFTALALTESLSKLFA